MMSLKAFGSALQRLLLTACPCVATATDSSGRTLLWQAAARGDADAVRLLLEAAPAAA